MISTKDISSGNIPKTLKPGNHSCFINEIVLEPYPFKQGAMHILLQLETPPIEGFDGFLIDKNKPELGKYKGQVGKVRSSEYAYQDGETKGGRKVFRDKDIMKFLQSLCSALDIKQWFQDQDNKHETIESFVEAMNKEKPFKGKLLNWCIGGKEYIGKSNYTNYDMFLIRSGNAAYSFESAGVDSKDSKLMKYDEKLHIKKKRVEPINSFEAPKETTTTPVQNDDFDLDN